MRWIIIAAIFIIGLGMALFIAGGRIISLDYSDFPRDKLEKLFAFKIPEVEITLSGPKEVQLSSPWTRWAMKVFPGTFIVDVRINGHMAS